MAVSTPYTESEQQYIKQLQDATTIEDASTAKSKLNTLVSLKWDNVSLDDMKQEIDARFLEQPNKGIYKSSYKTWKEQLATGESAETIDAARKLLQTSDRIIYSEMFKTKSQALKDAAEASAGSNLVTTEGNATLSGANVGTITVDDQGVAHIETTPNTVTVQGGSGAVIGGQTKYNEYEQDVMLLDRRPAWIDTNTEYHRTKTAQGFLVDSAIIKRYYSVIDAEVYFGNEYVEDVHDIHWGIQQNVQPLFGYNSYTYDEVARGNRLIVGSFTIVFTSPNYLFSILQAANKANVTLVENMASYEVPKLGDTVQPTFRSAAYGQRETGHHAAMWPQDFDIDIIFGEKTGAGDPVHVILLGVAIQSCQQILDASAASGPPIIMEQYQFIAQDIRTSVLSATGKTSQSASAPSDNTSTDTTVVGTAQTPEQTQANRTETAQAKQQDNAAVQEGKDSQASSELTGWNKAKTDGWSVRSINVKRTASENRVGTYTAYFTFNNGKNPISAEDKIAGAKRAFREQGLTYDDNKYEAIRKSA